MLLCCKEFFCFFYDHSAQCKQCDHIRNCHQSVEDICDGPYCTYCHIRSDKYCQNVKPAICKDCFLMSVCQIFQTSFTVIIPSKDCCKCEEYQTDHQYKCGNLSRDRKSVLECIGSYLNTFQTFYLPGRCMESVLRRKSCICRMWNMASGTDRCNQRSI